jgi:hypothetical protein
MQRPAAVTVFGILNIVFGSLGLCALLFSMAMSATWGSWDAPGRRVPLFEDPTWQAYSAITTVVGFGLCITLLAAGIGLLSMQRWARVASIGYAIVNLVMNAVGLLFTFAYVLPRIAEGVPERAAGAVTASVVIGGVVGSLIGTAYPILLLVFMTRAKIVRAFEAQNPTVVRP